MAHSAFFEIPKDLTEEEKDQIRQKEEEIKSRPKKTGGLSFDVTINENNSDNSTSLQSAAAILREKSEKRRSRLAARHQNSNNTTSSSDMPLTTDDLATDDDRASAPSEAGTYTLRLDSADVRDRRALYDSMIESKVEENPHNDSQDLDDLDVESDKENEKTSEELRDQNSATESAEDYAVPVDVSHRVSEWFDRNAAAESRQSEAKDENLEDIRQKAKERLEKCKEGKITLTRESRQKTENVRAKGTNPHIRMTRAMLLQRNRALGLDNKDAEKKKMPPPKTVPKPKVENRRVSARLENLSKPRARMMSEDKSVARARSLSHDVDTQKVAPHPRGRNPKLTKQPSNRSTSLSRAGTGTSLRTAKTRLSLDPKMSRPPTMSQSMREGRTSTAKSAAGRSTSLTRSNTSGLPQRTPRGTVSQRATVKTKERSPTTPSSTQRRPSTAASSRPATSLSSISRPQTAGSNIDKSHETSILYSMRLLSRACIDKSRVIYSNLGCSEVIPPLSPPDACGEGRAELEVLLSNLCHLDQVLGVIQEQSMKTKRNGVTEIPSEEPIDTYTIDSLAITSDEPTTVLNLQKL